MDVVERLDAALVELIETDPLGALRVIRDVGDLCTARAKQAADAAVAASTSWTDIGAALGVTHRIGAGNDQSLGKTALSGHIYPNHARGLVLFKPRDHVRQLFFQGDIRITLGGSAPCR